jgi:glycerol-3-phosphate dehydrogenase (NAD(P)+)
MPQPPIAILGAGNMASALALHLARLRRPVRLYCIEPDVTKDIQLNRCNKKYLVGHRFPKHVTASEDLATVLDGAEDVFVAIPSFAVVNALRDAKPFLSKTIKSVASITKGFDAITLTPIVASEADVLPAILRRRLCTIGGPAIATEMATGTPTSLVIAGRDRTVVARVKLLLEGDAISCATSPDLVGVGLASALKNAYTIALGLCDGLRYPANTKALVLTISIEEMAQLIQKAGGHAKTAYGLAGLGDLLASGMSPHGRNRTYGERLVGSKWKAPAELGLGTVEGISAITIAVKLARRLHVEAPLLNTIDRCLHSRQNFERPFMNYLNHLSLS